MVFEPARLRLAADLNRPGGRASLAWIEVFTAADSITGELLGMKRRPPSVHDHLFRAAGLVHCGLCCFVREDFGPGLTAFERGRD